MTSTRSKPTTSAMIASFADPGQRTTPAPFGHALSALADERPEIVGLSADLTKYTDMHIFAERHPERFFQVGMAEQVLLGAAAGMAEVGLSRSRPPTPCSRRAGRTTSCVSTPPSPAST